MTAERTVVNGDGSTGGDVVDTDVDGVETMVEGVKSRGVSSFGEMYMLR
jgi:hypothetical protein